MLVPAYSTFKKEVFDKLSEKERNVLFFWSLFEPSSWEEGEAPDFTPNFLRGRKRVLRILKRKSSAYRKYIKKDKKFDKKFIWNELLTNYLLTAQLEDDIKKNKLRGILYKNLRKIIFPDLLLKKGLEKIPIEIKGLVACSSLKERVKDEVIKNIEKNNRQKGKKFNKFLLLFLFPLCLKDNHFRINQLVEGYYVYEDLINYKTRIKNNVLCQCISEKYEQQFSMNCLSKRILKVIYNC